MNRSMTAISGMRRVTERVMVGKDEATELGDFTGILDERRRNGRRKGRRRVRALGAEDNGQGGKQGKVGSSRREEENRRKGGKTAMIGKYLERKEGKETKEKRMKKANRKENQRRYKKEMTPRRNLLTQERLISAHPYIKELP